MPDNFDLAGALKEAQLNDKSLAFLVNQHKGEIDRGDTVYLFSGGKPKNNPGLYATATVQTSPERIRPEEWQLRYGRSPLRADEAPEKPLRVRLKIEQVLRIAFRDVRDLPELSRHQFFTAGMGTNFPLTPEQADAIEGRIAVLRAHGNNVPGGNQSTTTLPTAVKSGRSLAAPLQNIHEAHLEELIASDLDQIEPGLTLIGRQHDAGAAGRIDLLCHSAGGDIVVVELKRIGVRAAGVVEQTMAYVGWALKHLAGPGQQVRGIIVGGKPDTKLQYAVGGIPNLKFRSLNVLIGDVD
jgi:hypothetical protein